VFPARLKDATPETIKFLGVSRNRDGKWVETLIREKDWATIGPIFCEVAVVKIPKGIESFVRGHLWITTGHQRCHDVLDTGCAAGALH